MSTGTPRAGDYAPPLVQGDPVEVDDGVFAILDRRVSLVPNVGIVVGERAALVVDTGVGPRNGAHVLEQARQLAGDRPLYLAMTQVDPGHGFGAQAFKGTATIVASAAQHRRLLHDAPGYVEVFLGFSPVVAAFLEGLELVEPDITYDDRLVLDLGGTTVTLRAWGPAHAADNQTVLVDDRVLFAGDLFETRMFPILPYFPPFDTGFDGERWIAALDELAALRIPRIVPGHGEVTDTDHMRETRDYLVHVRDETRRLRMRSVSCEDAAARIEAAVVQRWPDWEMRRRIGYAVRAFYDQAG